VRIRVRASGAALAIGVALLLAGCGGSGSGDAGSTSGTSSASQSAEPTYTVTVVGKKVTGVPNRVTLRAGERVRLIVTADRTSELHVHAGDPEIETHTQKGQPVTVEFTVKKNAGLYEVEMHEPDLLLFQVEVK
jgi:hypothetical protein